jgi:hypothetical protein
MISTRIASNLLFGKLAPAAGIDRFPFDSQSDGYAANQLNVLIFAICLSDSVLILCNC